MTGRTVGTAELIDHMRNRVAVWPLPDDVVDELPHTATGKIQKTALRDRFDRHAWPKKR